MSNSDGGHWYTDNGTPAYTQTIRTGKNKGKERNTNLRDAKKLGLLPSVTTVLNIMDKPALTSWKVDQAIIAALTCPREEGETEKAWIYRVKHQDATEAGRLAAEEGTRIHNVLEDFYEGKRIRPQDKPIADAVDAVIKEEIGDYGWYAEASCVHLEKGYAGKVDLHSVDWVVDFKTKDGDLTNVKCYEDHYRQLAAYREALGLTEAQCANVFISRDTKDEEGMPLVKVVIHDKDKSEQGWAEFSSILDTWQVVKKYNAKQN